MAEFDAASMRKAVAIRAEMKKELARLLTADALTRLSNVRAVKPQLALQAELFVLEASRAGQLRAPVSGDDIKRILEMFVAKKETRIVRK